MPYAFKRSLEEVAREKAPGPSPAFSVFHVLRVIELLSEKPIGRGVLAEKLDVGEGMMRTIIRRLKNAELITISRAGCSLTERGINLWNEYQSHIRASSVGKSELTSASHNFVALIRNRGHKLRSGMEQRDAAIVTGAREATTMVFKGGHLTIPSVSDSVSRDFPKAAKQVMTLLAPEENDVVVIVGADEVEKAQYGALASVWTLIGDC